MNLIYVFLGLLGGFLIAALFSALCYNHSGNKEEDENEPDTLPDVLFIQRSQSPFEAFKHNGDRNSSGSHSGRRRR